jgi:hypothetical protein
MDQMAVIARLREHAPELQAAGLMHVRVFGSTARGENSEDLDVDLLVEFDPARQQTLVSVGSLQGYRRGCACLLGTMSSAKWSTIEVWRAVRPSFRAFLRA